MKRNILIFMVVITGVVACAFQGSEPWTKEQLMPPSELAAILKDPAVSQLVIFSIGPGGGIKNSIEIGQTKDSENMEKLKGHLGKLKSKEAIVLYCGCCPFKDCPNIRPAFRLINEMKFTNAKLLDLSTNLKTDWIDMGYPIR